MRPGLRRWGVIGALLVLFGGLVWRQLETSPVVPVPLWGKSWGCTTLWGLSTDLRWMGGPAKIQAPWEDRPAWRSRLEQCRMRLVSDMGRVSQLVFALQSSQERRPLGGFSRLDPCAQISLGEEEPMQVHASGCGLEDRLVYGDGALRVQAGGAVLLRLEKTDVNQEAISWRSPGPHRPRDLIETHWVPAAVEAFLQSPPSPPFATDDQPGW